jgi:predicted DNA-binding protein (UPF0251 family)
MNSKKKKGRPKCLRNVEDVPEVNYFKPRGIPLTELESVGLKVEELEALKLRFYDCFKREEAARKMNVSRRTLEREVKSGIRKLVDALLNSKAIEIKGGYYVSKGERVFRCLEDKFEWKMKKEDGEPKECPECGSSSITTVG